MLELDEDDLQAVLATRLYNAIDDLSRETSDIIAAWLIGNGTVTQQTLFDDPPTPRKKK